jgi:hypothetical protein
MKKTIGAALAVLLMLGLAAGLRGQEITKQYKIRVRVDSAAVHRDRDSKSPTIAWVRKGAEYVTTIYDGEWYFIHISSGQGGMIMPGYISRFDIDVLEEKVEKGPDFFDQSPDAFKGIGLSVKLAGGMSFFGGGDIDTGVKGAFDSYLAQAQASGYTIQSTNPNPLTQGPEGGVDLIFSLNPKFGIGVGGSFLKTQPSSTFRFAENSVYYQTFWDTPAITVFGFRVEAYYNIALSPRLGVSLHGGPAYFHAAYDYDRTYNTSAVEDNLVQTATGSTLGLHGGVSLALSISARVAFVVDIRGRFARFTDLQGTEKLSYTPLHQFTTITEQTGSVYLITNEAHTRLAVLPDATAAALGAKKAGLDLSGIALQAGLVLRF